MNLSKLCLFALIMLAAVFEMGCNPAHGSCLKACTEQFKKSLVQIIGESGSSETELLAPFHSIIAKSRTNLAANRKIEWICFAVNKFDSCAKRCPANNAKSLRMASLTQWQTICDASTKDKKAFSEFVTCERGHIEKTSKKCNFVKINEQTALNDFCSQLVQYSHCYASVPFQCTPKASDVWLRINHAIQKSFNVLLQLSAQHLRLPPECQESMATTLPAGILTTHHPPLITWTPSTAPTTTTSTTTTATTMTPEPPQTPLYQDDSSTADDYSYFQQTDDYKFFGVDKSSGTTTAAPQAASVPPPTTAPVVATSGIDYWIDLDSVEDSHLGKASQTQRHVNRISDVEEDDDDIVFAEPTRFETRRPIDPPFSGFTRSPGTSGSHHVTPVSNSLNSGTSCTHLHRATLLVTVFFSLFLYS